MILDLPFSVHLPPPPPLPLLLQLYVHMRDIFRSCHDRPPFFWSSLERFILPATLEPHGLHAADPLLPPAPMRLLHQGPVVPRTRQLAVIILVAGCGMRGTKYPRMKGGNQQIIKYFMDKTC